MLSRLTHAGIAFAVTVVVYQLYVLLAVPFLEPQIEGQRINLAEYDPELAEPPAPTHKHRELLAAYFPADHWTLQQPPISFENEQALILVDSYQSHDDGQVRVSKCVMLFFPHERVPGEESPRDAIILEAPHGAVLQLDEAFQAGLGGISRLQWARLEGDIVIRSDMQEPGQQDDLLLSTRDLYMNRDLIRTDADVEMRLGPHWGHGKVLEVRLMAVERGESAGTGLDFGGIDSLEIREDIAVQLAIQDSNLFGGKPPTGELPPVRLTSRGRFKFDFAANLASFVDHVNLEQNYANGMRNRLKCDALNLYLAAPVQTVETYQADPAAATVAGRTRTISTLRPGTIEAHGTELSPVELTAETHEASARCSLLQIEFGPQRITLSDEDEVVLSYQGSEVHAPLVQYQFPPEGSGYRIGTLRAAGNGWLTAVSQSAGDAPPLEVRWTERLDLERIQGKPVLSALGRPRMTMVGGRLWADKLQMVLRERAADGSDANLLPADVVPERLTADGHVNIESAELSGEMQQLTIDVEYAPNSPALGSAQGAGATGGSTLLGGGRTAGRSYQVNSDTVTVQMVVRDDRPSVSALDAHGKLEFREDATDGSTTQPLLVQGEELEVTKADTPDAQITLRGQPATITAAGMSLQAVELLVNRGTSGAQIEAPGQLLLPINRDLSGKLLPQPEELEITWRGGMNLSGDRVTLHGDVQARTSGGQLNTNRLVAVLSAPVKFDGTTQAEQIKLAQLECREGVAAKFIERDAVGVNSMYELKLQSILANQLTGEIRGSGPGWMESVHLASRLDTKSIPLVDVTPATDFTTIASSRPAQQLRFLRIEFTQGVEGNLLESQRHLAVVGNVHSIYGPVASWEQKLSTDLQGTPAPDTVYIECQRLQVAVSPNARLKQQRSSAVELKATGNVVIEGLAGKEGQFTAHAAVASYDQLKTQFVLQGDGVRPATLSRQKYPGAPIDEQSFQSLIYIQATDEWKITGSGRGQLNLGFPGK